MKMVDFVDRFKDKLGEFVGWCFLSAILGTIAVIGLGPWWLVVMIIRHWPE